MGHVRNYVIGDICARYHKLKGDQSYSSYGMGCIWATSRECSDSIYNTHPQDWTL